MPTSAPGSSCRAAAPARRPSGFTILELLLVMAIVALTVTVAMLALRDPTEGRLQQEATRLITLFEAARAQARGAAVEVRWVPGAADREPGAPDFSFAGLPERNDLPVRWLTPGVQARIADPRGVVLGPEPIIGAQQVMLVLDERQLIIATDGLGPFTTVATETPAAPGS